MDWAIPGAVVLVAAVLLGCFVWFMLRGVRFSSDWVERYPSGAVQARGPHYHGDRQERWTFFYEGGQKESEGEYVAGFESGEWSFYHLNGRLRARGRLDNGGYKAGDWVYRDEVGHPLSEAEFLARYPGDSLHRWPRRAADTEPGTAADGRAR